MKLSEAIKHGATLRPESRHDRFIVTVNDGQLRSDAWGAACEAVQPAVAKFNWSTTDKVKFESAMEALRAVQHHYFQEYWSMPAQCPGAHQQIMKAGGRITSNRGEGQLKVYERGQKMIDLGGVTSECVKVKHMAGMVDHLFYAHGWSREKVAEVLHWYEETRDKTAFIRSFEHTSLLQDSVTSTTTRLKTVN